MEFSIFGNTQLFPPIQPGNFNIFENWKLRQPNIYILYNKLNNTEATNYTFQLELDNYVIYKIAFMYTNKNCKAYVITLLLHQMHNVHCKLAWYKKYIWI